MASTKPQSVDRAIVVQTSQTADGQTGRGLPVLINGANSVKRSLIGLIVRVTLDERFLPGTCVTRRLVKGTAGCRGRPVVVLLVGLLNKSLFKGRIYRVRRKFVSVGNVGRKLIWFKLIIIITDKRKDTWHLSSFVIFFVVLRNWTLTFLRNTLCKNPYFSGIHHIY